MWQHTRNIWNRERLMQVFLANHNSPRFQVKMDYTWTSSRKKISKVLINTHLSGSFVTNISYEHHKYTFSRGTNIIYKAAEPQEIIPTELQHILYVIFLWLEVNFKACLDLVYVPKRWPKVRLMFIPKIRESNNWSIKN